MFKSKVRPINIPQYQGVTLHDWHYGLVDNLPIREAREADWLKMTRKGVEQWFDDPITDMVTKLHLRRLLKGRKSSEAEELIRLIESRIVKRLPQTRFSREQFEWADKITKFCDDLAFDFSFEKPVEKSLLICTEANSSKETPLTYAIRSDGEVRVAPWPFSLPSFSGLIIGYERGWYPDRLQPKVLPYRCQPGISG
jgi:hypothetical protein